MTRLIDYQAAVDRYYTEFEKQDICDGEQDRDLLKQCFDESPTIDPVHAAGACYCRECTCWNRHDDILPDGGFPDWGYCSKMLDSDSENEITTLENDFCSWGQRREDTK